jgi:hypothetical protein
VIVLYMVHVVMDVSIMYHVTVKAGAAVIIRVRISLEKKL